MNPDEREHFRALDPDNMLGHIDALPDQFEAAWQRAQTYSLPESLQGIRRIVIAGMGGSAIGADYLAALVAHQSAIPIFVNRAYTLPGFAKGPETLVIASSHSGNTEETLSAFELAHEGGAQLMAITTGGELAKRAEAVGATLWPFTYDSQPRAAFGWSFGLLIGLAGRLKLAADLSEDVQEALDQLRQGRDNLGAASPVHQNPAKRLAGQFCERIGVLYGGGIMTPVARRWKCQINENAKNWAEFDTLPEQNHNGVAGTEYPQKAIEKLFCIFLKSDHDHHRVALRQELSFRLYLQEGISVDTFTAQGTSRLAQMMQATQFGDYVSYYLAMMNEVDPTPIPQIVRLKEGLAREAR